MPHVPNSYQQSLKARFAPRRSFCAYSTQIFEQLEKI
jgi:hypothetical protein